MIVAPNSPRPRASADRLAGGEPAARERQRDPEERAQRARAERARGRDEFASTASNAAIAWRT